jgi:uncharacterized protein
MSAASSTTKAGTATAATGTQSPPPPVDPNVISPPPVRDAPTFVIKISQAVVNPAPANGGATSNTPAGQAVIAAQAAVTAAASQGGQGGAELQASAAAALAAAKKKLPTPPISYSLVGDPVDVSDNVIEFTFDDEDRKADKATIKLNNYDLAFLDDPLWKKGNALIVSWGYAGNLCTPHTLLIQKITGSLVLEVQAFAMSILMHKTTGTATFENMKRSDVVKQIATSYGYGPNQQFVEDTEVVLPHTHQARMTDAEFMMHLAAREGFIFYVGPDGLHFERRKLGTAPIRTFTYFTDPGAGDILSWDLENDVTVTPGLIKATGRDALAKTTIDESGSNTDTDRDGTAPVMEVVDPRTKTTQTVPIAADRTIISNAPTAAAAKREVDGKFIGSQRAVAKISMKCVGDPGVRAKQVVVVNGISQRLSGRYYITKVATKVTASSYEMDMELRTDGSQGGPAKGPVASAATQNTSPQADPNALTPIEKVDPVTKTTTTTFQAVGTGIGS